MSFQANPTWGDSIVAGRVPGLWVGKDAVDGAVAGWSRSPVGQIYLYKPDETTAPVLWMKIADNNVTADWVKIASQNQATGFIPVSLTELYEVNASNAMTNRLRTAGEVKRINIPLTSLREAASNNLINAAGNGGILATDTTPIFEYTNGDTDSALRLRWASSNSDPLVAQLIIPDDYDETADMTVKFLAAMGGATDTPTISIDSFFDTGDTKVTDTSSAVTGTSVATYSATVAAADIPASAKTLSMEFTPGAHTTDTLLLYAVWVEYTVEATPKLQYANGDTDSGMLVTWVASDRTPVAFQTALPPDLDDASDVRVHIRAKSGGATDTPVLDIDSYFNEGDTKVEDATGATSASYAELTATIAAADVPSGAQVLTVEITPAAHTTDTVVVSGVWVEYTRS